MSGQPVVITTTMCPPLKKYDKEFQRRAARELEKLGDSAAAAKLISDYSTLRDACRKVNSRKAKRE